MSKFIAGYGRPGRRAIAVKQLKSLDEARQFLIGKISTGLDSTPNQGTADAGAQAAATVQYDEVTQTFSDRDGERQELTWTIMVGPLMYFITPATRPLTRSVAS